jgi:hypothetical protein
MAMVDVCVYENHIERIPSVAGFDWDRGNREKCQKHGVSKKKLPKLQTDEEAEEFVANGSEDGIGVPEANWPYSPPRDEELDPCLERLHDVCRYTMQATEDRSAGHLNAGRG